jgi:hypothetical protein
MLLHFLCLFFFKISDKWRVFHYSGNYLGTVRFGTLAAVNMQKIILWVVTPCCSERNISEIHSITFYETIIFTWIFSVLRIH